jgi:hypothetical protein
LGFGCKYKHEAREKSEQLQTTDVTKSLEQQYVDGTKTLLESKEIRNRGLIIFSALSVLTSCPVPNWKKFFRERAILFTDQTLISDFVWSLLQNLAVDSEEMLSCISYRQATQARNMFYDLLTVEYSIDAGSNAKPASFQRCLVPLVSFVATQKISHGAVSEHSNFLLGMFREQFGKLSQVYLTNVQQMLDRGHVGKFEHPLWTFLT